MADRMTPQEVGAVLMLAAHDLGVTLTQDELAGLIAIPARESSYNPFAYNPNRNTGDDSYGLWQINMLGKMGADRSNALGINNYKELFDPYVNAKAAIQLVLAGRKAGNPLVAWGGYKGVSNTFNVPSAALLIGKQVAANLVKGNFQTPDLGRFESQFASQVPGGTLHTATMTMDPAGMGLGPGNSGDTGQAVQSQPVSGGGSGDVVFPGIAGTGANKGGAGGAPPTPAANLPQTDADVDQYIKDNYGYLYGLMKSDPQLEGVLKDAARNGVSKDLLYGKLSGTTWFQTTSASARQWAQTLSEDPAQADALRAQRRSELQNLAGTLGVQLSVDQLNSLTEDSLKLGYTSAQLTDTVLNYAAPGSDGYTGGQLGAAQQQVQQAYADYLTPLDKGAAADYAKRMASGEATIDGVRATLANGAKAMFANEPAFQKLLDQGYTPADYFSQHKAEIARTLEVSPDSVDFVNDQRWRKLLDVYDPNTNSHRPATVWEAGQAARDDPAFRQTQQSAQLTASAGSGLLQAFGL